MRAANTNVFFCFSDQYLYRKIKNHLNTLMVVVSDDVLILMISMASYQVPSRNMKYPIPLPPDPLNVEKKTHDYKGDIYQPKSIHLISSNTCIIIEIHPAFIRTVLHANATLCYALLYPPLSNLCPYPSSTPRQHFVLGFYGALYFPLLVPVPPSKRISFICQSGGVGWELTFYMMQFRSALDCVLWSFVESRHRAPYFKGLAW